MTPYAVWVEPGDDQRGEDDPEDARGESLAADGLDQRVRRVDADEHQHEQEQHQDCTGVDDDLHREQERRVLRGVQDREAHHHDGEQQGRVHGLAYDDHADRAHDHDRRQGPEGDHAGTSPSVLDSRVVAPAPR